jgi:hypothetical protein
MLTFLPNTALLSDPLVAALRMRRGQKRALGARDG